MYCSKCGTFNNDGSVFCNKCGNQLNLRNKQPVIQQPVSQPVYQQAPTLVVLQNVRSVTQTSGKPLVFGILSLAMIPMALVVGYIGLILGIASAIITRNFGSLFLVFGGMLTTIAGMIFGAVGLKTGNNIISERGYVCGKEKVGRILSEIGMIVNIVFVSIEFLIIIITFSNILFVSG